MGYTFSTLFSFLILKTHVKKSVSYVNLIRWIWAWYLKIYVYWLCALANLSTSITLLEKIVKKSLKPSMSF